MGAVLEVGYEDIERLSDRQLTDLLRRLLYLEAQSFNIPMSSVAVPLKIDVPDGGEDGRIRWDGQPDHTDWIPSRFTVFQCKACKMDARECGREVLIQKTQELKPRIEEVLDAGGSYVLFYGRSCNENETQPRVNEIRRAIASAGKAYADTADIRIYDANRIAGWVNKYIAAVVAVLAYVGGPMPEGLLTWNEWAGYGGHELGYVTSEKLAGHIRDIRNHFREPRRVARICGLPGLGKTRLALEAFRPPKDPAEDLFGQMQSSHVVYLDAAGTGQRLPVTVAGWRRKGLTGTLVVDNCPLDLHQHLCKEIQHRDSLMSLLTLDYEPGHAGPDSYVIQMEPAPDEVIRGMLEQAFPELPRADMDRIVSFAQGFPLMAVLLARARLSGADTIGLLDDDVLMKKLIWGREQEDQVSLKVITACALFERIGFEGEHDKERKFVAQEICGIDPGDFYQRAMSFVHRGILSVRGHFAQVIPRPLAVRLAADWWTRCAPETAASLLAKPMPGMLAAALCDQMAKLHFLPKAREVVSELCGESAPFGQAEVLNSERGSRLFRSLVEVNPEATVEALWRVFGHWSRDELMEVGPGRRNLVWALEKLCFHESTFPTAARLMLALAGAENETWANNATNQFLQLFQPFLSGTQTPASQRLDVIDEALTSSVREHRILAVKALGRALRAFHFSRDGGPEIQGSRPPLKDWQPKVWGEVFDYWRAALNRLTPLACEDGEIGDLARKQIADSIRGMVHYGRIDDVETCLSAIVSHRGPFWPDALGEVQKALRFEAPMMPGFVQERLQQWVSMLQPKSTEERLRLFVSVPPYADVRKEENGTYTDLAREKAERLAEELALEPRTLYEHLSLISRGEQRQGYAFGRRLAQCIADPHGLAKAACDALRAVPPDDANPSVLGGFLSGIQSSLPSLVAQTLDEVARDKDLVRHLVELTRLVRPEEADLKRVLNVVRAGRIPIEQLRAFAYGSVLCHLPTQTVVSFCDSMLQYGETGAATAHEVLYMYSWNDPEKWNECKHALRKVVLTPGLLRSMGQGTFGDVYRWQETVLQLLSAPEGDWELADHIIREVLCLCHDEETALRVHEPLVHVLGVVLSRYAESAWPALGEGLLSGDWGVEFCLRTLLASNDWPGGHNGAIAELPAEVLLDWCEQKGEDAQVIIARLMPLLTDASEAASWHSLALSFIDRFGENPGVLSSIEANMSSFSWTGSSIPHYEKRIRALEELRTHRLAEVRRWAQQLSSRFRDKVREERLREEDREWGVHG